MGIEGNFTETNMFPTTKTKASHCCQNVWLINCIMAHMFNLVKEVVIWEGQKMIEGSSEKKGIIISEWCRTLVILARFLRIFDFQHWLNLHKCCGEEMPSEAKVLECFYAVRCSQVFQVYTLRSRIKRFFLNCLKWILIFADIHWVCLRT